MREGIHKDGLTVRQLIKELKKVEDKDIPFYVCSDEEGNTTFKGLYLNVFEDAVDIRGLSGCEVEDEPLNEDELKAYCKERGIQYIPK